MRMHRLQSLPGTAVAIIVGGSLVLTACSADTDGDSDGGVPTAQQEEQESMSPGSYTSHSTTFDGIDRSWNVFVPQVGYGEADHEPMPVVLVIHGTGDTGNGIRGGIGMDLEEVAEREGFVIAYVDGYRNNWNECRIEGDWPAKEENVDDVGLMREIVAGIHSDLGPETVDPETTYAIGFSSGGNMAQRLALEAPDLVSRFASVNANVPVEDNNACTDSGEPVPAMFIQGREDPIVPFDGGEVIAGSGLFAETRGHVMSAYDGAEWFAERNGAEAEEPASVRDGDAEITTWDGDAPVTLIAVDHSGHSFPTSTGSWGNDNGARYDAPGAILGFFSSLRH
ncbi:alpha/beta hydrolase family esterase [Corynebacterium sputi]|uniref:alpha/beta hydrolase family esterase n=1 Tax=Corynebacterium sputi TaxID=489915 RepID=UPI00146FB7EE|nr:PHB depolymerase family esterase [Corynebacterium sputi]